MADASSFDAAKGEMGFAANGRGIDVRDASFNAIDELENASGVAGVNGAGEAEADGICGIESFVETLHANDAENRAEDFFLSDAAVRGDMVKDCGPDEIALVVRASGETMAAEEKLPFLFADLDVPQHSVHLLFVHGRAHFDAGIEAIADCELLGAINQLRDEGVRDFFFDDNSAGGGAALAGGCEGAEENGFDREWQIGVGENDDGILAAHFALDLLHAARAAGINLRADFRRAGEGDGADVGALQHFVANFRAGAEDEIQHAWGQARFLKYFHDADGAERRDFGGLEHAGVSGDERRRDFPDRNGDGKIPGGYGANYAERRADCVGKILEQFAGKTLAGEAPSFAGHEFEDVDAALDFAERVLERFAFLAREHARQFFLLLLHDADGFEEDFAAIGSRSVAPGGECGFGGGDGFAHLVASGKRNDSDDFIRA